MYRYRNNPFHKTRNPAYPRLQGSWLSIETTWNMEWWAKALVAGVLFERGLLRGTEKQDAVKALTWEEADCILQIVGQEMGLDAHSSCFQMRFEEIEFEPPREVTLEAEYGIWRRGQNSMPPQQGNRYWQGLRNACCEGACPLPPGQQDCRDFNAGSGFSL